MPKLIGPSANINPGSSLAQWRTGQMSIDTLLAGRWQQQDEKFRSETAGLPFITYQDYEIDQGLLWQDKGQNCAYYQKSNEGKYISLVRKTWTDKGQLLQNLAVTGFAPATGRVPWAGFAWNIVTAPQLHETVTLEKYCSDENLAGF